MLKKKKIVRISLICLIKLNTREIKIIDKQEEIHWEIYFG